MGQGTHLEAHGGSSYCAIATLHLLGKLDSSLSRTQVKHTQVLTLKVI